MKKQITQRLTLNRETLRRLTGHEAAGVAGGGTSFEGDCTLVNCTTGGQSAAEGGSCIGCQRTNPNLCN